MLLHAFEVAAYIDFLSSPFTVLINRLAILSFIHLNISCLKASDFLPGLKTGASYFTDRLIIASNIPQLAARMSIIRLTAFSFANQRYYFNLRI
jgi:predicted exporter